MSAGKTITLHELDFIMEFMGERINYKPILGIIQQDTREGTLQHFMTESDPDGVPWLPLKNPRRRARDRKNRHGYGDKILGDSGTLRSSVTSAASLGNIDTLTDTMMEVGSNLEYAGTHQDGALIHKPAQYRPYPMKPFVFPGDDGEPIFTRRIAAHDVIIPRREFLGFNEADLQDIDTKVADHVERQILARLDKS